MNKFLTREQYYEKKWSKKKIYWKNDCPFCFDYQSIWEWKYWYIVRNISPYCWNENHLMAVPFSHKKYSIELSMQEFQELKTIHKFVRDYFWDKDYFSATRESMWNRSVEHLHIHFVIWKLQWKYLRKMLELQWYPIKEELKI